MASRRRYRSYRRNRSRRRSYKGGDASTYMLNTVGAGNVQYDNVFRQGGLGGPGPSNNAIVSLAGQRAGRRRRGGSFLGQAAAPAALMAAAYMYSKRRGSRNKKFSRRRRYRGGSGGMKALSPMYTSGSQGIDGQGITNYGAWGSNSVQAAAGMAA